MGSSPSTEIAIKKIDPKLKQYLLERIDNKRLKLSHESNIYAKGQSLQENYAELGPQFQQLFLNHNMINTGFMDLLAQINTSNLKVLSLSNNELSCESLKSFRIMKLKFLEYLFLDHNDIGNDGCFYLTKTNLQSLLTLDLDYNAITSDGCRNLARATLPNIRTVLINHNKFNEKGLQYLSLAEWPLLSFIQAKHNEFQPTKQLQKVKFKTEIKVFRLQIQ